MSDVCLIEKSNGVLTVTISRPKALNALLPEHNAEFEQAFDDFAKDDSLRVAIITGAGDKSFSTGDDLSIMAGGTTLKEIEAMAPKTGFCGLTGRLDLVKPVIAAVNGYAFGGGFEVALAADLVVASDNAIFCLSEPKVGVVAVGGSMHRLPRQIGLKGAMGILLTGRNVTAKEGLELGFINEVTSQDNLMTAARKWAEMMVDCAPLAVEATKQCAMAGLSHASLEEALNDDYALVDAVIDSEDAIEGPKAFMEKRRPVWKGH